VLSLVILLGPGRSAFRLYTSAYGEQNLVGDVKATARVVLVVYSSLTAAGYIAYLLAGAGFFNSLLYVMATVSTGGFSPEPPGAAIGMSVPFNILRILFMISGAIGFPAYYLLRRESVKAFLADLQLRYLAVIAFVAALIFLTAWGWSTDRIIPGVFHAVSAITTTGFSVVNYQEWPRIVVLISIFLMFVGGSAGSTAGGLKLFRLIVIVQVIKWVVVKALLPEESEISIKVGQVTITETILRQVLSILGLYMILIALSTLAFVLYGFDLIDSLFECVSAIGTVGLSSGLTSSNLPAMLKGVLIVDMWAGRLEILPVVIVFYARVWIPKWRKA
jgi:trk system potassium uptake protein TrkH